ncbi:hypothetical protein T08_9831 [Trichinella sp. T8]|nr:hypothetical protein T08_9831 [Trichinella sp. T8]
MSAIEKLRSFGQGREIQKTAEFLHSSIDVVSDFCQRQYTLSDPQKQRKIATPIDSANSASSLGIYLQPASASDERRVPLQVMSGWWLLLALSTLRRGRIPHFLVQVSCRCDNASQPSFGKAVTDQPLLNNPSKGIRCCRSWSGSDYSFIRHDVAFALGLGGEAQPVMVEGFSGATQVVPLLLSWVDGGQSTKRYPLEVLTMLNLCHRLLFSGIRLDLVSDDDSSDEVHVMTSIDYYHLLLGEGPVRSQQTFQCAAAISASVELKSEGMGESPKNESDALDPEKRFREWHLFDGTRYSKY